MGEVPVGEIVVAGEQSRRVFTGVYATRMVCLRIPLLFLYGLLLYLPPIRNRLGERSRGATARRVKSDITPSRSWRPCTSSLAESTFPAGHARTADSIIAGR